MIYQNFRHWGINSTVGFSLGEIYFCFTMDWIWEKISETVKQRVTSVTLHYCPMYNIQPSAVASAGSRNVVGLSEGDRVRQQLLEHILYEVTTGSTLIDGFKPYINLIPWLYHPTNKNVLPLLYKSGHTCRKHCISHFSAPKLTNWNQSSRCSN